MRVEILTLLIIYRTLYALAILFLEEDAKLSKKSNEKNQEEMRKKKEDGVVGRISGVLVFLCYLSNVVATFLL